MTMQLSSPAFDHGQPIPVEYTCDGKNISPPLSIDHVPDEAKSLALIIDDPDTPKTWVHWVVYNLAPQTEKIHEGASLVDNQLGMTDFNKQGYGGPCPPSGTHRYYFRLYALDFLPQLPGGLKRMELEERMAGHIIDEAQLMGTYQK